jgi:hypothetical protein
VSNADAECVQGDTCQSDTPGLQGSALLQLKYGKEHEVSSTALTIQGESDDVKAFEGCARALNLGIGLSASLDSSGFNKVRQTCCTPEMAQFIKRLIEGSAPGKGICHSGGLYGLAVWYDCTDDNPGMDFNALMAYLDGSEAESGDCPWIGYPKKPNGCPSMKPSCKRFTNVEDKCLECKGEADEDFCCGTKTGYTPVHANFNSNSKIAKWDCDANAGAIQILTDGNTKQAFNVSKLDIQTGRYTLLYQISLTRTQPKMDKKLLAATLNPVDGIPYAFISISLVWYLVRFDDQNFEFIAKMPPLQDYSGTTNGKDNIFFAAFGDSGTLFFGGSSSNQGSDMFAATDVAKMNGYAKYDAANLPYWKKGTPGVTYTRFVHSGADIVVIRGDFDKSGTSSEWLFMVRGNDFRLAIAKVPTNHDISTPPMNPIYLDTDLDPSFAAGSIATFGAAWSFQNQAYFSRNNGDGVFHVATSSINIAEKKYTLKLTLKGTSVTNNNDGFNCMDALPPFPGKCTPPEVELDKVDGQCPS